MAPKVVTGKKFGGGQRLVEGMSLGLFCPNAVETKTDLQDHWVHCSRFSLYEKRKNMETKKFNGGGGYDTNLS